MKHLLLTIGMTLLVTPAWAQTESCVKGNAAYPACLLKSPKPDLPAPAPGPTVGTQNYEIKPYGAKPVEKKSGDDVIKPGKLIVN